MLCASFEDFVTKTQGCNDSKELFDLYACALKNYGYDRVLFALITDHTAINQSAGVGIMNNFPEDWMGHYFSEGYDKIDPVIIYGMQQSTPYDWDSITNNMRITSEQQKILSGGQESGLNNGISTYLRDGRNEIAGVSLASSEKQDAVKNDKYIISAYSHHFYYRYKEIHQLHDPNPENIRLTEREREVLLWASRNKSNNDIAQILGISSNTVEFHLKSIFDKLNARGKIIAVVKAIQLGLINP